MKIRKYLALALSVLFLCAGCGRTAAPEDAAPSDFVGTEEISETEYDRLCAYIEIIDTMNDLIDDDLENIVNEEIDRLFNGKCTAQQCADMIQSRAAIYIAERS